MSDSISTERQDLHSLHAWTELDSGTVGDQGGAYVDLIDLDNDGKTDRVFRLDGQQGGMYVQSNNGEGFDEPELTPFDNQGQVGVGWNNIEGTCLGADGQKEWLTLMADMDGDGFVDRVSRNATSNDAIFKVELNNRSGGFSDAVTWGPVEAPNGYTF